MCGGVTKIGKRQFGRLAGIGLQTASEYLLWYGNEISYTYSQWVKNVSYWFWIIKGQWRLKIVFDPNLNLCVFHLWFETSCKCLHPMCQGYVLQNIDEFWENDFGFRIFRIGNISTMKEICTIFHPKLIYILVVCRILLIRRNWDELTSPVLFSALVLKNEVTRLNCRWIWREDTNADRNISVWVWKGEMFSHPPVPSIMESFLQTAETYTILHPKLIILQNTANMKDWGWVNDVGGQKVRLMGYWWLENCWFWVANMMTRWLELRF